MKSKKMSFVAFKDKQGGKWKWNLQNGVGKTIGTSSKSYMRKRNVLRVIDSIKKRAGVAEVIF